MKFKYDPTIDALSIVLNKKGKYSHSQKVSDEINIDISTNGKPMGIEILDASKTISDFRPAEFGSNMIKPIC